MPITGAVFSPGVHILAWIFLGIFGIALNLLLRRKTLDSLERTRQFYAVLPPHRVDEYRQYLSLLTEGAYQSRKYALFAFCQLAFALIGYLALWYPPRLPRSPYDQFYGIMAATLILAAEIALDTVSILAWRKTAALEELATLDWMPSPPADPRIMHGDPTADDPPLMDPGDGTVHHEREGAGETE